MHGFTNTGDRYIFETCWQHYTTLASSSILMHCAWTVYLQYNQMKLMLQKLQIYRSPKFFIGCPRPPHTFPLHTNGDRPMFCVCNMWMFCVCKMWSTLCRHMYCPQIGVNLIRQGEHQSLLKLNSATATSIGCFLNRKDGKKRKRSY